jgi:hypothetical protein
MVDAAKFHFTVFDVEQRFACECRDEVEKVPPAELLLSLIPQRPDSFILKQKSPFKHER